MNVVKAYKMAHVHTVFKRLYYLASYLSSTVCCILYQAIESQRAARDVVRVTGVGNLLLASAFHAARQSSFRLHSKYKKYVRLINSSINYAV